MFLADHDQSLDHKDEDAHYTQNYGNDYGNDDMQYNYNDDDRYYSQPIDDNYKHVSLQTRFRRFLTLVRYDFS